MGDLSSLTPIFIKKCLKKKEKITITGRLINIFLLWINDVRLIYKHGCTAIRDLWLSNYIVYPRWSEK